MLTPLPIPVEKLLARLPWLAFPVRFGYRLAERWEMDACSLMAGALAFFGLLSSFPLALAGVAILARMLAGDRQVLSEFALFVGGFFPGTAGENIRTEVERAVTAIAEGPDAATVSLVAVASLLWSGRAYFDTLATVLNRIWPGTQVRYFWRHQWALLSLMLATGALFVLSTLTTLALSLAQRLAMQAPELFINRAPMIWDQAGKLAAWVLTVLMFYLLYHFGPNREVPDKHRTVWGAAVCAALLWEVAKWVFAHFLGNVARYQANYGSVAGIVVTMLWIYTASLIILLGAESAASFEEVRRFLRGGSTTVASGATAVSAPADKAPHGNSALDVSAGPEEESAA